MYDKSCPILHSNAISNFNFGSRNPCHNCEAKLGRAMLQIYKTFKSMRKVFKEYFKVTSFKNLNFKSQRWKNLDLFVGSVN